VIAGAWSTADIGDQSGRTALITGANSGIGLETARELARKGATVILACRNSERAEAARADITASLTDPHPAGARPANPPGRVEIELVDMGVLASVRALADRVLEHHRRLDLLVNNAGIMAVPRSITVDGAESQLATNHLGHFLLTGRLLDSLAQGASPRVVNIASLAHRRGRFDFDDMTLAAPGAYSPMGAYRRSKLANLLFTYELQRRLAATGSPIRSVAAHPGLTETRLFRGGRRPLWFRALRPAVGLMLQPPADGALPTLRAAVGSDVEGGDYLGPARRAETSGPPVRVRSNDRSHDADLAVRLWRWSEQAAGLTYPL
jgi:NAD(P)-dependent dehydrogenase (short-subunit alcohol dehydrogenase family)